MLTKEQKEEMDVLLAKENPTEAELARVDELEKLEGDEESNTVSNAETIETTNETSQETTENQEEATEATSETEETTTEEETNTAEVIEEAEVVEDPEDIQEFWQAEDLEPEIEGGPHYVKRYFTVEKVKKPKDKEGKEIENPEYHQLWGRLRSWMSHGLASDTRCFAIDVTKALKEGETVKIPSEVTVSIRQSHRKRKKGEEGQPTSTFDWLQL